MKITESVLKNMIRQSLREKKVPEYEALPKWRNKLAKFLSGPAGRSFVSGLATGSLGMNLADLLSQLGQEKGMSQITSWVVMFDDLIEKFTVARDKLKRGISDEELEAVGPDKTDVDKGEEDEVEADVSNSDDIDDKLDAAAEGDKKQLIVMFDELIEYLEEIRNNLQNQIKELEGLVGQTDPGSDEPIDIEDDDIVSSRTAGEPPPLPKGEQEPIDIEDDDIISSFLSSSPPPLPGSEENPIDIEDEDIVSSRRANKPPPLPDEDDEDDDSLKESLKRASKKLPNVLVWKKSP
jgi:hypothetical protein